jgi:hypothetical protein
MSKWIAERKLLFSQKGSTQRRELIIRIGQPYLLEKGRVNFEFHEGAAGCPVDFAGLDEDHSHEAYGADSLQALQLAVNVERVLETLSKKYDLFFPSGEPYFEVSEDEKDAAKHT